MAVGSPPCPLRARACGHGRWAAPKLFNPGGSTSLTPRQTTPSIHFFTGRAHTNSSTPAIAGIRAMLK